MNIRPSQLLREIDAHLTVARDNTREAQEKIALLLTDLERWQKLRDDCLAADENQDQ